MGEVRRRREGGELMGLRSGGYEVCCCFCVVGGCWIICYDDEMEDINFYFDF